MKNKTLFQVFNESDSEAKIILHGRIGEKVLSEDEETITVKEVRNKLKDITADKIKVHL